MISIFSEVKHLPHNWDSGPSALLQWIIIVILPNDGSNYHHHHTFWELSIYILYQIYVYNSLSTIYIYIYIYTHTHCKNPFVYTSILPGVFFPILGGDIPQYFSPVGPSVPWLLPFLDGECLGKFGGNSRQQGGHCKGIHQKKCPKHSGFKKIG